MFIKPGRDTDSSGAIPRACSLDTHTIVEDLVLIGYTLVLNSWHG